MLITIFITATTLVPSACGQRQYRIPYAVRRYAGGIQLLEHVQIRPREALEIGLIPRVSSRKSVGLLYTLENIAIAFLTQDDDCMHFPFLGSNRACTHSVFVRHVFVSDWGPYPALGCLCCLRRPYFLSLALAFLTSTRSRLAPGLTTVVLQPCGDLERDRRVDPGGA